MIFSKYGDILPIFSKYCSKYCDNLLIFWKYRDIFLAIYRFAENITIFSNIANISLILSTLIERSFQSLPPTTSTTIVIFCTMSLDRLGRFRLELALIFTWVLNACSRKPRFYHSTPLYSTSKKYLIKWLRFVATILWFTDLFMLV